MAIPALIDKQDTAEIVRDQISAILALEVASQVQLAAAAARDPDDYRLRVFQERSSPWEVFPSNVTNTTPVVNVSWDTSTFDGNASNAIERQKSVALYNLDCYGYGVSRDVPAGGHSAGDQNATEEAQRAVRLVRNILMAAEYTYLDLRGVVWRRWVNSISLFQPQQDNQNVHHVAAARVVLRVEFNEYSPQFELETLDLLTVDVHRTEDDQIVIEADYDYT